MSQVNSRKKAQIIERDKRQLFETNNLLKKKMFETDSIINDNFESFEKLITTLKGMFEVETNMHSLLNEINFDTSKKLTDFLRALSTYLEQFEFAMEGIEAIKINQNQNLLNICENINIIAKVGRNYAREYLSTRTKYGELENSFIQPIIIKNYFDEHVDLLDYENVINDFYKTYRETIVLMHEKCYKSILNYVNKKKHELNQINKQSILQKIPTYSSIKNIELLKHNRIFTQKTIANVKKHNTPDFSANIEVVEAMNALTNLKQIYKQTLQKNIKAIENTKDYIKENIEKIIIELQRLIQQYKNIINSNTSLDQYKLLQNGELNKLTEEIIQKLSELNNSVSIGEDGSSAAGRSAML